MSFQKHWRRLALEAMAQRKVYRVPRTHYGTDIADRHPVFSIKCLSLKAAVVKDNARVKPEQSLLQLFKWKARLSCAENVFDLLEIPWRPFHEKNKSRQSLVLRHNFQKFAQTEITNESPFVQLQSSGLNPGLCVFLVHEGVQTCQKSNCSRSANRSSPSQPELVQPYNSLFLLLSRDLQESVIFFRDGWRRSALYRKRNPVSQSNSKIIALGPGTRPLAVFSSAQPRCLGHVILLVSLQIWGALSRQDLWFPTWF